MKKWVRGGDPQLQRYWEEVVRRWQEGGQAVRAFCRAEGLRESAFYFWRRELARRKEQRKGRRRELRKEQKGLIAKKGKSVSTGLKASAAKAFTTEAFATKVPAAKVLATKVSLKQWPRQKLGQKLGPAFLPVRVVASHGNEAACANEAAYANEAARGGVEIVLDAGCVVRVAAGFDRQTLADVLSILESRPC